MSHYISPQSQLDFSVYFQLLMDQYLGRNGLRKLDPRYITKRVLQSEGIYISEDTCCLRGLVYACRLQNDRVTVRLPIESDLLKMILDNIYAYFSNNGQPCQGIDSFYELFVSTKLPNNELTSIHTHDLPHLLL